MNAETKRRFVLVKILIYISMIIGLIYNFYPKIVAKGIQSVWVPLVIFLAVSITIIEVITRLVIKRLIQEQK